MRKTLWFQVLLLVGFSMKAGGQSAKSPVLGQWEGESICTIKTSPCHDEHVIYRVTQDPTTPEKVAVAAYKVVDGKELYMGTLNCGYSTAASELRCQYKPTDLWIFKLSGDTMKGTLTVDGNTLYRNISLKRVPVTVVKEP